MTQHNRPPAPKRTVFIFDPHAHTGTVKTFFDPRTALITSNKTPMTKPAGSFRAAAMWRSAVIARGDVR